MENEKKIRDSFCCCLNAQFSSQKLFFSPPLALLSKIEKKAKKEMQKCKNTGHFSFSVQKVFFLLKWNCCCIEKLRKMSSTKFSLSVKQVHTVG